MCEERQFVGPKYSKKKELNMVKRKKLLCTNNLITMYQACALHYMTIHHGFLMSYLPIWYLNFGFFFYFDT